MLTWNLTYLESESPNLSKSQAYKAREDAGFEYTDIIKTDDPIKSLKNHFPKEEVC